MKAIQTQSDGDYFNTETQYVIKLNGKWHRVTHREASILDGRYADTSNVERWDTVGKAHCFKIEPCENPEQEIPEQMKEFIRRFEETGESSAVLKEELETFYEFPGYEWGWSDPKEYWDDPEE